MKQDNFISRHGLVDLVRSLKPELSIEPTGAVGESHYPELTLGTCRSIVESRTTIARAVSYRQLGEAWHREPAHLAVTNLLDRFVDGCCGDPAQQDSSPIDPAEVLAAAIQFLDASTRETDHVLKSSFLATANRLFKAALARLGR